MAIEIWNPFEDLTEWSRRMMMRRGTEEVWMPTVDIYSSKNNDLIIEAELPGVSKEDVNVTVTGKTLTISGERKKEEKVEKENYYRMEAAYGKFERSISLPVEVKPDTIEASYKNGILTVTVPGAGTEVPTKTKIEVKEEAA
jgi:HSP20 family protein